MDIIDKIAPELTTENLSHSLKVFRDYIVDAMEQIDFALASQRTRLSGAVTPEDVETLSRSVAALASAVTAVENEVRQLQERLAAAEENAEAAREEASALASAVTAVENEVRQLQERLATAEENAEAAREEASALGTRLSDLEQRVEALEQSGEGQ